MSSTIKYAYNKSDSVHHPYAEWYCAIPKLRNVMHDCEAVYAHTVKYPFHVVWWTMDLNIKTGKAKNRGKMKTRYWQTIHMRWYTKENLSQGNKMLIAKARVWTNEYTDEVINM